MIFSPWIYCLFAILSVFYLLLAVLILPNKGWAARLFNPVISALVNLLRKLSRTRCLAKWENDIREALDDAMRVRFLILKAQSGRW